MCPPDGIPPGGGPIAPIVGVLAPYKKPTDNQEVAFHRRTVSGSLIGSIAETQEVLDFCAQHGITADVEVIPIQQINEAVAQTNAAIGGAVSDQIVDRQDRVYSDWSLIFFDKASMKPMACSATASLLPPDWLQTRTPARVHASTSAAGPLRYYGQHYSVRQSCR